MTRTLRTFLAATVAVAAITMAAAPSPAAPSEPVRTGRIAGWGATWVAMFNGEARDCQWSEWGGRPGNPECKAWLVSGCSPALAGRETAVTASIVDVADLAGRPTQRAFEWRTTVSYPGFGVGGGVVVQMWRKDCTEIVSSKWRSIRWYGPSSSDNRSFTEFAIPADAAWMTVTTNDTANLEWTLR